MKAWSPNHWAPQEFPLVLVMLARCTPPVQETFVSERISPSDFGSLNVNSTPGRGKEGVVPSTAPPGSKASPLVLVHSTNIY